MDFWPIGFIMLKSLIQPGARCPELPHSAVYARARLVPTAARDVLTSADIHPILSNHFLTAARCLIGTLNGGKCEAEPRDWLNVGVRSTDRLSFIDPRRHRGVDATPSGFPRVTHERIGRSSRNLVYLIFKQICIFPENFNIVPTKTLDL